MPVKKKKKEKNKELSFFFNSFRHRIIWKEGFVPNKKSISRATFPLPDARVKNEGPSCNTRPRLPVSGSRSPNWPSRSSDRISTISSNSRSLLLERSVRCPNRMRDAKLLPCQAINVS
ncbi:hypothetical protein AVEN_125299-1 [Araneus ventricosus]|uniref:Uncharacterized protein n=1 Tax=Araneus ventricosus TaxID=182803 RepID=A0A4Y2EP25_ARAVE|nr:hypothetical protein AVEN_125299-1 [Araneus ventricosus]